MAKSLNFIAGGFLNSVLKGENRLETGHGAIRHPQVLWASGIHNQFPAAFNDDFQKTENAFPQELINELYTKEEQSDFWKKAGESRTIVNTEYYDRLLAADGGQPA